ncbi:MAG: AmmeMemoRadiSam system radical SAM enzyme [Candidatus Omnitrophica bacterium]|nr:AmmeMemoRadiSam system radical SAM enzyme [Candidatus Omnitrophota bacterium]MDD5690843.1 AmmeMemoRadiSam system radical SAM enzyme [Candidatus Omnitrophota bacterium]
MKEALLYTTLESLKVRCQLCSHNCLIQEGKFGFCGVRQNIKGVLYTHSYGKLVAVNIDPVEKKPLYHFLPGSLAFSIASAGCNFRCGFCQNWQISQFDPVSQQPGEDFSAQQVVRLAKENNCKSIAYTYTEPTVYFEFALETARLAKEAGLYNIFVSNGYMSAGAIDLLKPYLDAANIDLKFFKDNSYQKICSAHLKPVLDSILRLRDAGIWIEVTTLVIPGENDTLDELSGIARFIASVNRDIPWHVSRFHADYKFYAYRDTPEETIRLACDLGNAAGLHYIYAGNVNSWGLDTFCPACKKVLIKRKGFRISEISLANNRCVFCQANLAGVFNSA